MYTKVRDKIDPNMLYTVERSIELVGASSRQSFMYHINAGNISKAHLEERKTIGGYSKLLIRGSGLIEFIERNSKGLRYV